MNRSPSTKTCHRLSAVAPAWLHAWLHVRLLVMLLVLLFAVPAVLADERIPADPPIRWWKGNLHTHSLWSDGNDFPEMIAEWYRVHDYNFLALSDHNVLSEGTRWMNIKAIEKRNGESALDKYLERFGADWVETRGDRDAGTFEVRLKPLDEFRSLVDDRGQFIMMEGEEISDAYSGLPVHMNATNLENLVDPTGGNSVREVIANNMRAVEAQARRLGREILVHLNHPNFHWAITAEDFATVVSERFVEVYNGHPGIRHLGDAHHPSVERMWDIANTLRIAQLKSPPLFGLATDDSHTYHGKGNVRPGRGWVMVRARHLTPETIVKAIKRGDFYASSGVTLVDVNFSTGSGSLDLEIAPDGDAQFTTEFIGTMTDYPQESQPRVAAASQSESAAPITRKYSDQLGKVLATAKGLRPSYKLTGKELYVRAVVTSSQAHQDPSFKDQKKQAWTQPVGWRQRVSE